MRLRPYLIVPAATLLLAMPLVAWSDTSADRVEYPLAPSTLKLRQTSLVFKARWSGPRGTLYNPQTTGSQVTVSGAGGSGKAIDLIATKWKSLPKNRGYHYVDRAGTAGGVRSILLVVNKKGGAVKLKASGKNFPFSPTNTSTDVSVTLAIGTARWCAEFSEGLKRASKSMVATSDQAPASCPCTGGATSPWEAIQTNVIARYGCTAAACHSGPAPQGGLDLSPDVAYANLVGKPSQLDPSLLRVKRADRTDSVLWLKLATKTLDSADYAKQHLRNVGAGMPSNELTISAEELEAIRLWIQNGAPETGVVSGTDRLLSACLPPPDPIKIQAPDPPAQADGVQFYGPAWTIAPKNETSGRNGENEICQATHYDVSATIPDSVKLSADDPRCRYWSARCSDDPGRHCFADADCNAGATCQSGDECFFLNRSELTQDPNSHHSIIHIYRGQYRPGDAEYETGFGPFTCRAGANAGQACDITRTDQCPGSICAGRVATSIACVFYGPTDFGFDVTGTGSDNSPNIGGSQQPYDETHFPEGVYAVYPVRGTIVWNSHAFNVTDKPTTNEQWLNVFFAKTDAERVDMVQGIFDSRYIFTQNVPPFEKREYCATKTMDQGARVFELSSHTHKRGVLWRTWLPPNQPCTPCAGGGRGFSGCSTPNPACTPNPDPPLVVTTTYNDPAHYVFPDPLKLDSADDASRTIKYCAVFDNGATDPSTVKRNSSSPPTPFGVSAVVPGGPCYAKDAKGKVVRDTIACLNGPHRGQACHGDDRACDSAPGANDGVCDACPLGGGVTTEDEMFILLGFWYWPGH